MNTTGIHGVHNQISKVNTIKSLGKMSAKLVLLYSSLYSSKLLHIKSFGIWSFWLVTWPCVELFVFCLLKWLERLEPFSLVSPLWTIITQKICSNCQVRITLSFFRYKWEMWFCETYYPKILGLQPIHIYMFAFDRRCGIPVIWYYLQVVRDVLILDRVFTSLVCSQEQPLLLATWNFPKFLT